MQPSSSPSEIMGQRLRRTQVLAFPLACLMFRSQEAVSFLHVSPPVQVRGGSDALLKSSLNRSSSSFSTATTVSPRFLSEIDDGNINDGNEVIIKKDIFMIRSDDDNDSMDIESSMTTTFEQRQLAHRLKKLNRDPLWPQDHGRKRKGVTSSREKVPMKELRDFISGATAGSSGRTTPTAYKGKSKNSAGHQPATVASDVVSSRVNLPSNRAEGVQKSNLSSDLPSLTFDFEKTQNAHRRRTFSRKPKWPQSQCPKIIPRTEVRPVVKPNGGSSVGATVVSSDVSVVRNEENDRAEKSTPCSDVTCLPIHTSVATDAGPLWKEELRDDAIHPLFSARKRVLVLCTGGTLTMSNDPTKGGSLVPVQGALTSYLAGMRELTDDPDMPEIISHEYKPLIDSSDMSPAEWAMLARDINTNYYFFDGFVILMGTDTMAYAASALSFMLQNLSKPVIFTGSQIPLGEPYNDARKNLIMATIFSSRDTVTEVCIFFHDRLLRGCRATKVNTSNLKAFDSPNIPPLAEIGINIKENYHIFRPPPRGSFKINTSMDTRLITLRLVPGFDDASLKAMIEAATQTQLKGLVLQLYGTGNLPSLKDDLIQCLANATAAGVVVVATTQCISGSVIMGRYATGQKLLGAGVVSACDMTVEATTTKLAYLLGRGDLSINEVRDLMTVDLRGEITPECDLPPPPLASTYQRVIAQKDISRRY